MNEISLDRVPRRWFRFSLRTLFLLVTVFACLLGWLGRELYVIRHRQVVLKEIETSGGQVFVDVIVCGDSSGQRKLVRYSNQSSSKVFAFRKLLGDKRVSSIRYSRQLTTADRQAIEVFPEAEVMAIP